MAQLSVGSVVAGCRIEAVIGRGGMGVVYRAVQESLQRTVALKVIAPELTTSPDFRERFKRESRLAASIEHPNVIPVYEAGQSGELLYLIMRYIEGTDLRALLQAEGALEPARAGRIAAQVAAALGAAHRRGLMHRDVKPANVLLDDGHAYLTDFGIARRLEASKALTRTGVVVGTLDYVAPERIAERAPDARADVYALGCVLFEALSGRVPYPRDNDLARMYAHMNDPVPSVREVRPEVPEPLGEIAARAMAKNPNARFATADDMATALTESVTTQPRPLPPVTVDTPTALTPEPTAAAPPPTAHAPGPTQPPAAPTGPPSAPTVPLRPARRTGLIVGGAVALVAAVVMAVVLLSGGGSDEGGGQRISDKPSGGGGGSASRPLDPRALDPIDLGPQVDGIEVGAGSVWVANKQRGILARVDPDTLERAGTTSVGGNPDSVAVSGRSVWVTNTDDDSVSRVGAGSGEVEDTVQVGDGPEGIAAGKGAIWVANSGAGSVTRIDPAGGSPRTVPVGSEPIQLAFDPNSAWVTNSGDGTVQQLEARTGKPASDPVQVGGWPRGIAFADDLLWVSVSDQDRIAVIDPFSRRVVDRIAGCGNPREVRAGEGAVWVSCADESKVAAIDTSSRSVEAAVDVRGAPFGLGVGEGKVWAGSLEEGLLTPIEPR